MQDTFLGTYQRQYFLLRVEVNIIPPLVEPCHGFTQLRCTHRRLIAVGIGLPCHLTQFLNGLFRGRHVRTANGQTDNILALSIQLRHLLQLTTEIIFLY